MRLTHIKLAGFKSFVDPTHIPVPGQLVGVVGPNGCGKSNIIDAVRWVLGESSARHLRGETMQDVLFNGAGTRQQVNRASVELIFDNSLGKAAGQWANYGEISVKRLLERDGESSYYINNIHVRRRDVADIFLGTGLGARAYAIIEQGMISRIIEAKPEDLRIFLEEAAGVSKYRERRRETESRLADTRENLLRVDDIRQELDKQLEHLQGQAEVATRYRELQGQLHTAQNLLWFVKQQDSAAQRARYAREIERLATDLEAETARLREAERRLEELRGRHFAGSDAVHAAQGALYEANAEVARLEQHIQHLRDSRLRVENQLAALRSQLAANERDLAVAIQDRGEWQAQETDAREHLQSLETRLSGERGRLPLAEAAFRTGQTQRDEKSRALAQAEQALQVEQTRREHAGRILEQLRGRAERLSEEQNALILPDSAEMSRATETLTALDAEVAAQRETLERDEQALPELEQALRDRNTGVDVAAQQVTALEARLAALQQIQDRIAHGERLQGWLETHDLGAARRLWQDVEIEAGWEDALEAVLAERLNGIALDALEQAQAWLGEVPPAKITVYAPDGAPPVTAPAGTAGLEPLLGLVRCHRPESRSLLEDWLYQVYVVRDRHQGLALRTRLPAGALLVSSDGHVFGRHSVSFHAPDSELHGVLARQREIEQLADALRRERENLQVLKSGAEAAETQIAQRKEALQALRATVSDLQQRRHDGQLAMLRLTEQTQRVTERGEQIARELAEISAQTAAEQEQHATADSNIAGLDGRLLRLRDELTAATAAYRSAEQSLAAQREALAGCEREFQEGGFRLKTCAGKVAEIGQAIERINENLGAVRTSIERQAADLAQLDETPWRGQLEQALASRQECEQALAAARDAFEASETELRQLEQERLALEQSLGPIRERSNDLRLKEQEARLIEEQFAQQLAEAGADATELAAQLEKGMRASTLQADIARLNGEIAALGAVNLAALEELQTATERKNYLDAQSKDLTEAMTTLEDAIRRIDRETRERLQHTFDEVNGHFGKMFPTLFGGGTAKLVLTGEEILDSGVQVIAQPPGKRNQSIHLLSGGEKALTALSLVFSMFQLNPAPFCLLDEVDAPLDDTNTERFCELVKKMSAQSQFLFISHNKITMEIANQLIGVTMQEAGVSRVVAVDIEEAMKLAEKAA